MRKRKTLSRLLLIPGLSAFLMAESIQAEPVMIDMGQISIEDAQIRIRMKSENTGIIVARCPGCKPVRLKIDKNSKVTINQISAKFKQAQAISNGFNAVLYNPKTSRLIKLMIKTQS